jgi:hypothetical protein
MAKRKRLFVRRWHYQAFSRNFIDMDPEATMEQVAEALDQKHGRGNWFRDSLKRGDKIKAR